MLYIERAAMEFTCHSFLVWIVLRREYKKPLYDSYDTVKVYFAEKGIKANVLDVDGNWFKIHLGSGVQSCVFKCFWYHEIGDAFSNIGESIDDVLDLIHLFALGCSENEIITRKIENV